MSNYKYVFDVYTIKDMYHNIMPQQMKTVVRNELRSMPQNFPQIKAKSIIWGIHIWDAGLDHLTSHQLNLHHPE